MLALCLLVTVFPDFRWCYSWWRVHWYFLLSFTVSCFLHWWRVAVILKAAILEADDDVIYVQLQFSSTFFTSFARVHLIDLLRRYAPSTCCRLPTYSYTCLLLLRWATRKLFDFFGDFCRKLTIRKIYHIDGHKYFHEREKKKESSFLAKKRYFSSLIIWLIL